ncbi:hypothetical protein [Anaerospora sp.]|nr:hypothetical protein [Anaerospora sp.]
MTYCLGALFASLEWLRPNNISKLAELTLPGLPGRQVQVLCYENGASDRD